MHVAARPYVLAGAALAAAGVVTATPVAQRMPDIPLANPAIRLVADGDSLLNVPLNLFYDFVNIPYNEVQAMNYAAESLFNSGPWFVVSATNLWGVDPGDPSHFMAVMNMLVPFPELSGMNAPELDFSAGLGQQLWGMVAAALPISSACDAADCLPVSPTSPITGIGGLDWSLWLSKILAGQEAFPLTDNWFKVSFDQLLNGYYFDPSFDGSTDPSGPAYEIFPNIPGTGPDNAVPWSGETYTLEPWVPFENYFNSLLAPPSTDGIFGTGIEPLSFEEFARAYQSLLAASAMAFDPFTPGSPFCPGECNMITDLGWDYPDIVRTIDQQWPGNTTIETWLNAYDNGVANVPTAEQIENSIAILQQPFWDFANPSPPDSWNLGGIDYSALAPMFYDFWESLGFDLPPLNPDISDAGPAAALAAGADPTQFFSGDLDTLGTMFGASSLSDFFAAMSSDLAAQLQAELSSMLASFGADLPADFMSTLPADLLTLF